MSKVAGTTILNSCMWKDEWGMNLWRKDTCKLAQRGRKEYGSTYTLEKNEAIMMRWIDEAIYVSVSTIAETTTI